MDRRVILEAAHHFRPVDVENLGLFPQAGDEALTADWLGTARYAGLEITQDGANAIRIEKGRVYIDNKQFTLDAGTTKSLVAEKPLLAGEKRVVILAAQGQPNQPAAAISRNATVTVPNESGPGTVKQVTPVQAAPYLYNALAIAVIAGPLGTQETDPAVPDNAIPFARVVLDLDGIVTYRQMLERRSRKVVELDASVDLLSARQDVTDSEVAALRNTLVSIEQQLRRVGSQAAIEQLAYDMGLIKDILDVDDVGAPYALDRFNDAGETNTAHIDYNARIDNGLQFPYANVNRAPLALFNPNDPKYRHANAGVLFPAYDTVIGHAVHSTGQKQALGGTVTEQVELKQMTRTRVRVRYGNYFHYHYHRLANFHPLRGVADIAWRIFAKHGEVLAYPYGYYTNVFSWWRPHFHKRVYVDTVTEAYDVWQKVDKTIEGVIKFQSWQQSQERYIPAVRLAIYDWEPTAEITLALCEFREDGNPDHNRVLATKTLTAAAFQRYQEGNAETMTRFAFDVPPFARIGPIGYVTSCVGQVNVGMASGDQFLGGNYGESTDGRYYVGSILKDMAHAVEFARFRSTTMDARLLNLNLDGGIQNADIICPATTPKNTSVKFEVNSGGGWKMLAQVPADPNAQPTETDEIFGNGTTATYDHRAFLTGNEWVMPVLELGNAEATVFRSDVVLHHVSVVRIVPGAPAWVRIKHTIRIAGYDPAYHTLDAYVKHGATLAATVNEAGPPTIVEVPGNNAVDVTWTFTVDPADNQYEVHTLGTTSNAAKQMTGIQAYSRPEAA